MPSVQEQIHILTSSTPAQLRAEWRRVFRKETPPHSPDLLIRAITWRLQSRTHGDLSRSTRQRLARFAQQLDTRGDTGQIPASPPAPGTRLVREWNERTIEVTVLEAGYMFDDRHFTSLSQIARHVTGTQWSGPRFFGLRNGRKPSGDHGHGTH